MDPNRLQWITRPATLDSWSLHVRFAETPSGCLATVNALGFCDRKRGAIWSYDETIEVAGGRYGLHDLVTHLSLVIEQDRPASEVALTRSLIGAAWEQPELPF